MVYLFTTLIIASCNLKVRIWPERQPPPSLQPPSCSGMSTSRIPTTCSQAPGSFSSSPTIIAPNTVTRSPTQGITTRKCSILPTQFPKCVALLHMSKRHQVLNSILIATWCSHTAPQPINMCKTKAMYTHTSIAINYALDGLGNEFQQVQRIFPSPKPSRLVLRPSYHPIQRVPRISSRVKVACAGIWPVISI